MPMARSSPLPGSSSTTMARLAMASRNGFGIDASASATRLSNFSRCTVHDGGEVVALALDDARVAERRWLADAAAMEDEGVGRARPARLGHRVAELLLDDDGVVAFGDADAIGHAKHVPIDRKSGDAERVAEHDVGGLPADARQLDKGV